MCVCNVWAIQCTVTNEKKLSSIVVCFVVIVEFVLFLALSSYIHIFICCILTASIERNRLARCACVSACACVCRSTLMNHKHTITHATDTRAFHAAQHLLSLKSTLHWYIFEIRFAISRSRRNKPNQWDYSMPVQPHSMIFSFYFSLIVRSILMIFFLFFCSFFPAFCTAYRVLNNAVFSVWTP